MLWEDDFHKVINEELGDKFYQAVDEIDGTQDDVIMKLVYTSLRFTPHQEWPNWPMSMG